jgi:hypothetical protein
MNNRAYGKFCASIDEGLGVTKVDTSLSGHGVPTNKTGSTKRTSTDIVPRLCYIQYTNQGGKRTPNVKHPLEVQFPGRLTGIAFWRRCRRAFVE